MSGSISTINVPFHGDNLYVVNYNGQPYVPMKPIVEGMGLTWQSQFEKVKQRFKSTITEIVIVAADGKERNMLCLALRKLAGWLHTISPNKVKPEIRDKVIRYQEECDDVLYEYWTTGEVKPKQSTTTDDRAPLRNAVDCLMTKKRLSFPKAYKYVHAKYGVNSIDEVPLDLLPEAVDYIYSVALEGEYIPKQESLPAPKLDINYPLTWYPDNFPYVDMCFYKQGQLRITRSMLAETRSPSREIFSKLKAGGYDVSAAEAEIESLKHVVSELSWAIDQIGGFTKMNNTIGKTFTA
ncbi:phage antirepressor N-terminal domain-containing protein [Morganella morganii]|nr:phage antirepressor Ant [Morganella morganii]